MNQILYHNSDYLTVRLTQGDGETVLVEADAALTPAENLKVNFIRQWMVKDRALKLASLLLLTEREWNNALEKEFIANDRSRVGGKVGGPLD